jgi:hypothetical protein
MRTGHSVEYNRYIQGCFFKSRYFEKAVSAQGIGGGAKRATAGPPEAGRGGRSAAARSPGKPGPAREPLVRSAGCAHNSERSGLFV